MDIYRALIESIAFGTRTIVENFEQYGIPVTELYACGGMAEKNPLLMQIFADVTGRPIKIARSAQSSALGAAMFAAVAAGEYETIYDAIPKMGGTKDRIYAPNAANHKLYTSLFDEYTQLHDYFGRGANDVMKRLRAIKAKQRSQ